MEEDVVLRLSQTTEDLLVPAGPVGEGIDQDPLQTGVVDAPRRLEGRIRRQRPDEEPVAGEGVSKWCESVVRDDAAQAGNGAAVGLEQENGLPGRRTDTQRPEPVAVEERQRTPFDALPAPGVEGEVGAFWARPEPAAAEVEGDRWDFAGRTAAPRAEDAAVDLTDPSGQEQSCEDCADPVPRVGLPAPRQACQQLLGGEVGKGAQPFRQTGRSQPAASGIETSSRLPVHVRGRLLTAGGRSHGVESFPLAFHPSASGVRRGMREPTGGGVRGRLGDKSGPVSQTAATNRRPACPRTVDRPPRGR